MYVDPHTYSNPYTATPVYTSGPVATPAVAPPAPSPPPAASPAPVAYRPAQTIQPSPEPLGPGSEPGTSGVAESDPRLAAGYEPAPGELAIKERRTWKTWQLVGAVLIAVVAGMAINGATGSASGHGSGNSGGGGYTLPAETNPSGATTPSTTSGGSSPGANQSSTTTTTGSGSTTTTVAGVGSGSSSTTTTIAVGPATVLIPATQQTGPWTSPAFTIAAGQWNIGWAFQCVPVPSTPATFQVFVVKSGGAPGSTPAVTSTAASGQAVTPLSSIGSQQLVIQTSPSCEWVVKVTGFSG